MSHDTADLQTVFCPVLIAGEVDQTLCQVMVQQQKASSKSLRLPAPPLDLQQRGSSSTQIHQAPNASPWQSSPEKYLTKLTGMHAMHSGQAAIRVSSQPGGVKKPEGSLEGTPAAGGGKTAKALSGAEKRSPLKGSNAWPPASPSPKKGMLGRSQNRAPNVRSKGNFDMPGGVQQPGTDPLALLRWGSCQHSWWTCYLPTCLPLAHMLQCDCITCRQ